MLDERLLERLDASPEVKRHGRSAVLRRAAEEYLRRERRFEIAERYRAAYGAGEALDRDWSGWSDEGTWPDE